MSRLLVIFTVQYPFGFFESFVEAEINELAAIFPKIVIQPVEGDAVIRRVPHNVIVAPPLKSNGPWKFYLGYATDRKVWVYFGQELPRQVRVAGLRWPVIRKTWMWASMRRALEESTGSKLALRTPEATVAYSYWGGVPALAIPKLSSRGVPCAVRYHSGDLFLDLPGLERCIPWREEVAKASSLSLFISERGRAYFVQTMGPLLDQTPPVVVSRLGSPDHGLGPTPQSGDALTIVSCSFIYSIKRVHLIAELLHEISKQRRVVWHHFGGGDYPALTQVLDRTNHVQFERKFWGTVPHKTIISFLKTNPVHLFVNLSTHEGIPVSIMEAISFGIPVVATDVGAVSEIVITGRSGLLVSLAESEDVKHLAERILAALDPDGAIGRSRPREVWAERYDAARNHAQLAKILLELLPSSR
jgi:colanic acid/amylovoran biosynthesis glycosyltransferase